MVCRRRPPYLAGYRTQAFSNQLSARSTDRKGIGMSDSLHEIHADLCEECRKLAAVVAAARGCLPHPYESREDDVCIHCGVIGSYGHLDDQREACLRDALNELDKTARP